MYLLQLFTIKSVSFWTLNLQAMLVLKSGENCVDIIESNYSSLDRYTCTQWVGCGYFTVLNVVGNRTQMYNGPRPLTVKYTEIV